MSFQPILKFNSHFSQEVLDVSHDTMKMVIEDANRSIVRQHDAKIQKAMQRFDVDINNPEEVKKRCTILQTVPEFNQSTALVIDGVKVLEWGPNESNFENNTFSMEIEYKEYF